MAVLTVLVTNIPSFCSRVRIVLSHQDDVYTFPFHKRAVLLFKYVRFNPQIMTTKNISILRGVGEGGGGIVDKGGGGIHFPHFFYIKVVGKLWTRVVGEFIFLIFFI